MTPAELGLLNFVIDHPAAPLALRRLAITLAREAVEAEIARRAATKAEGGAR